MACGAALMTFSPKIRAVVLKDRAAPGVVQRRLEVAHSRPVLEGGPIEKSPKVLLGRFTATTTAPASARPAANPRVRAFRHWAQDEARMAGEADGRH